MGERVVSMDDAVRIGAMALNAEALRQELVQLKSKRGAFHCEQEDPIQPPRAADEDVGPFRDRPLPCWKSYENDDVLPQSAWCATCRSRQRVHLELVKVRNRLGGQRAALARVCARALKAYQPTTPPAARQPGREGA